MLKQDKKVYYLEWKLNIGVKAATFIIAHGCT